MKNLLNSGVLIPELLADGKKKKERKQCTAYIHAFRKVCIKQIDCMYIPMTERDIFKKNAWSVKIVALPLVLFIVVVLTILNEESHQSQSSTSDG